MNAATHTAADAERALRALQRDPAAVGYGAFLRRKGLIGLPEATPASEVREAEAEVRRAVERQARP